MSTPKISVGLCGIGLEAYWTQFVGLHERLLGYVEQAAKRLERYGTGLLNLGMVDSTQKSRRAGDAARQAGVDLLIIYVTTYALSSTVLPMAQRAKCPVLILNLPPSAAIDYATFNRLPDRNTMTGEWLAYCSACPLPEIANVFIRAGIPFHQVMGVLGEDESWLQMEEWIAAATVKKILAENRIGLMGHYYSGMLDVATDITQVAITFGCDMEHLEVDELTDLCVQVNDPDICTRTAEFRTHFDVQQDCRQEDLERAARTSLALDRLVEEHRLGSVAYYAKGSGVVVNEETMSSIILGTSLLTARGIPVAGEYEIKNVLTMKIMDSLGAGGSFTEYYALDLNQDHVLMGHDGPGHIAIAQEKTKVRPLSVYHGKVGHGLSVEMSVRHGPVTLLSVAEDRQHGFKLLCAHGESVPGEILRIGNTNGHYQFPVGARGFVEGWNRNGPAHHCAVGTGHVGSKLKKLAQLLQIPFVQVC